MNELSSQQLQLDLFINEINKYDSDILDLIHFDQFSSSREMIQTIVQSLRDYNLHERKCHLCLLNYVLQRIGRQDLAIEILNPMGRAALALD